MKGRKHFLKIALTSVLSVTMCLTGALAVKSVIPANALAEGIGATVNVTDDVIRNMSTNDGTITYVADKKQVSNENTFSGICLTGKTGTKFDLGNFKLDDNRMYWNGNVKDNVTANMYTGTNDRDKAANADNATSYGSFFSYVYDPNSAAVNEGDLEVYQMEVKLTEVGNADNWMSVSLARTYYDGKHTRELRILAAATGNTTYGVERYRTGAAEASGTTLNENARKYYNGDGTATEPLSLVWDNEKATVYTTSAYPASADGINGAWGIRQFKAVKEDYAPGAKGQDTYASRNYSSWNGFTDGATLNCTVEFVTVNSEEPSSIIITSLGGHDLTSETYDVSDMAVETENAAVVAGAQVDLLQTIRLTDGLVKIAPNVTKVTVKSSDEAETEIGLEEAKTYAFGARGEYTVTYYDGDKELGSSVYTVDALTFSATLTNGKLTKADGTEVAGGDELALDDELTFTPTGEMTTARGKTLTFDTIRSLAVNGTEIAAAAKHIGAYTFKVGDYVSGTTLNVEAKGDTEVNIYVTDSDKGAIEEKVAAIWATDGQYQFAGYNSINYTIQDHFKELSDGSYDMLMGFGRYEMVDSEKTRIGEMSFLTKQSLCAYAAYNDNKATVLDKDNYFEALWLNVKTSFQIRVGENDSDSGMRLVTEIKQSDVELYNFYNVRKLGLTVRTNLTTLENIKAAKDNTFDIKTIKANHWMTSGWDPVAGKKNNLGLYAPGSDTAGKPLFYQYGEGKTVEALNKMVSGVTEGYIGYAITLVNFREANIDKDYVFQSTWTCNAANGGATGCVGYAKQGNMKDLATAAYDEAFGAELGGEYQYTVTVNGEKKYSKYTEDRLQWLVKMAGMTETVTVGA